MPSSLFSTLSIWTTSSFRWSLLFYLSYATSFWLIYDICNYLVMGHVFYDIFLIIIVLLLRMKFYHGHHWQKYGLQNGSFPNDIGVLLLGDIKYTSLHATKFYFMHFYLFSIYSIWALSFFRLGLVFYLNYAISLLLIYDICDYLVMGPIFYTTFSIINVLFMKFKFYHGHH